MHNIMIIYFVFIIIYIYIYVCMYVCTPMNWGLHGRYYQKGTWSIQNNLQTFTAGWTLILKGKVLSYSTVRFNQIK